MDAVVRGTYRSLLLIARRIETRPVLNAFLASDPNRVYDPRVSKWHSLKQHPSEMHSAKHRLVEEVRDYCRGVFYLPHVSDSGTRKLRGRIYSLFRHPLTGHDTVLTRLSIAYLAIRYLSKCTYLGDALVTRSIAPRAVYASITIAPRSHRIGRGAIVLAHPMLLNSGFTQSVVLLVYRSDASLLGLVLNRTIQKDSPDHFEDTLTSVCTDAPVTAQDKYDLLDFFDKSSIFYGGVVDSSRVSLLHSHAELAEHSILVSPGIYWTDNVKEVLLFLNLTRDKSTVNGFKVFIGLAVWGREQLEGEISSNYWMEVTLSEADCKRIAFTGRSALSSIGEGVTLPTCVSPVGYDTVSGHRVWAGAMASLPGEFKSFAEIIDALSPELSEQQKQAAEQLPLLSVRDL